MSLEREKLAYRLIYLIWWKKERSGSTEINNKAISIKFLKKGIEGHSAEGGQSLSETQFREHFLATN